VESACRFVEQDQDAVRIASDYSILKVLKHRPKEVRCAEQACNNLLRIADLAPDHSVTPISSPPTHAKAHVST